MITPAQLTQLDVTWTCSCGTVNVDNFALTAEPLCSHCDSVMTWEELAGPERMSQLNCLLTTLDTN
jgi:hypothetical protein